MPAGPAPGEARGIATEIATRSLERPRLVQRLLDARGEALALLVAPAGYGKSTLLGAWAARERRTVAWIGLGEGHDDELTLRAEIAAALEDVEPPFALVLDGAEALHDAGAWRVVEELVDTVPSGSIVAVASRCEPDLPVGRLRAHRRIVELRGRDMVMTRDEAAEIFADAGLSLTGDEVAALVERTEGWPAALYLAGVALGEQEDVRAAITRFAGDDRLVSDYLRDEFLAPLSAERQAFLVRTAPLERLSGLLCDAVLERHGSGRALRELGRSNALLVELGRDEAEFRHHRLFGEMLRAELHRSDPEAEIEVHRRASTWFDAHGDPAQAIDHAIAAGDIDRAGELLWRVAAVYLWDGRCRRIERWLTCFSDQQILRRAPLALTAAAGALLRGDEDAVERWLDAAVRRLGTVAREDRRSLEAGVEILRATLGRAGLADMERHAARATQLEREDSPWRPLAALLTGAARELTGDLEGARQCFEDGARRGAALAPAVQVVCLAELALLALLGDDWDTGLALAARARSRAGDTGLEEHAAFALVAAVSAFAQAQEGHVEEARRDAAGARRLLGTLGDDASWYGVQTRIALARAELRLSDVAAARTLVADASRIARRTPEAVVLRGWIEDAWARADTFAVDSLVGPSSLTTAELRVLRFLPSHFSFREIAERLHVSANTVKTQAHAVYRKLDASSRTAAVARARQLGLLDA